MAVKLELLDQNGSANFASQIITNFKANYMKYFSISDFVLLFDLLFFYKSQ